MSKKNSGALLDQEKARPEFCAGSPSSGAHFSLERLPEQIRAKIASGQRGIIAGPWASIGETFKVLWDRETLAGFDCPTCGEPVSHKFKALAGTPHTLGVMACGCPGAIVHYEDDTPEPQNGLEWQQLLGKLAAANGKILFQLPIN